MEIKRDRFTLQVIEDVIFISRKFSSLKIVRDILGELARHQIPLNLIVKDFTFSPENFQKLSVVVKGEHREKVKEFFRKKGWETEECEQSYSLLILEAPALRKFSGIIYDVIAELEKMDVTYYLCSNSEIKIMFVVDRGFSNLQKKILEDKLKRRWSS